MSTATKRKLVTRWDWGNPEDRALIVARLNWLQRVCNSLDPDCWDGGGTVALYQTAVFDALGDIAARAGFPELLGVGCARVALELPAGNIAKIAYNLSPAVEGRVQNRSEWALWHTERELRHRLCPLVGITHESVLIQRRCDALVRHADESGVVTGPMHNDYNDPVEAAMLELSAAGVLRLHRNCGFYNGRVVAHDFGALMPSVERKIKPAIDSLMSELGVLSDDMLLEADGTTAHDPSLGTA